MTEHKHHGRPQREEGQEQPHGTAEEETAQSQLQHDHDSQPERSAELERELVQLREELEQVRRTCTQREQEVAELKDKFLRAVAEADNSRKRIRQQADETVRLQRESLLRDLLAIVDNLERAVAAARGGGNGKPIVEGVEMVLRSMIDFLRSHGVTQLSALGQPFDPLLHEAVDQIESDQHQPNTVVDEFVRGYQVGDRLLRPARVAVAKLPSAGKTGEEPEES
ncbi:MAG TPA: nucleotide exchange factor GrpE [Candidatus Binataceae bacterium]|nr:nucleotide exchange factor GrpE [Candidatus Binataceae bacterium]